jgi:hypothetical protein
MSTLGGPSPLPPDPKPPERVFSVQKAGRQIDCELRAQGELEWECQFFDENWCIYRRRWATRTDALADADEQRQKLLDAGWMLE